MSRQDSRRDFLKKSTVASAGFWVAGGIAAKASNSALETVNFGCIGVGGKGRSDSADAGKHGNVVAICDIDDNTLNKAAVRFAKAQKFNDYRVMLEKIGKSIDAVTVSTPDHSHAPASILAMKMGKACFTQKPMTWSIEEARKMREVAKEMKVATQMGNQGTANSKLRESVEIIQSGALGNVKEVHVWTNRPIWPQGTGRPKETPDVPSHVHWDLFLGPAQERPYSPAYHPFKWRGWLDFGTGALGDMACHTLNMPFMALSLRDPLTVSAECSGIVENETYPKWSQIEYKFGKRGDFAPCKLTWYDGGKLPPAELFHGEKVQSSGALVVGEKGTLLSLGDYGGGYKLLPGDKFADFKLPERKLPRSPGHFVEYVNAIKGGDPAMSNFDYAGPLTETVLLGNVALRASGPIEWNAEKLQVTNDEQANEFIRRKYRKGWSI